MEGSDPSAVPLLLQASLAALDAHQHRGAPYRRPPTGSEGAWLRQAPRRRGSLIESHESHRISPVKLVFVGAAPAFTTVCLTLRDTHPPKKIHPRGAGKKDQGQAVDRRRRAVGIRAVCAPPAGHSILGNGFPRLLGNRAPKSGANAQNGWLGFGIFGITAPKARRKLTLMPSQTRRQMFWAAILTSLNEHCGRACSWSQTQVT